MKRLLCVAAALAMVSCIPVDDFGASWDKGVVDPALEGTWKLTELAWRPPTEKAGPEELRFKRAGSSYSVYMISPITRTMDAETIEQQRADNARAWDARTLRVGNRRLLMERNGESDRGGIITSYEISGRTLSVYWLESALAARFLRNRHPDARNIHKNEDEGEFVVIETLDDEVVRIMSEFVSDPAYWHLISKYQKASK